MYALLVSRNQISDLLSGKYDKIVDANVTSIFYRTIDTLWDDFQYASLNAWGFKSGDSICIKYYSVNSTSYYMDKSTGKRVYPSLGNESNIYTTKLK